MQKIVITEFCKNVFADFVLRLMKSTGGYDVYPFPVLGLYGCVWKNGRPSHPKQLRKAQDLRMPTWHRLMMVYMNRERTERIRAGNSKSKKRYFKSGNRLPFTPRSYTQPTP